jgi:branched-chain amino acid transport system permease protein
MSILAFATPFSSLWKHVFDFLKFGFWVLIVGVAVATISFLSKRFGGSISGAARDASESMPKPVRWSIALIALIGLYVLPMWTPFNKTGIPTTKVEFLSLLSSNVVPFVLIALGLNVVVGMAGLLDLGYVGFYAIGAYTVGVLTSKHGSWPWIASLPVAVIVSMLMGVLLGAPTLRLRGDYLAIVTLGFGEIIRLSAENFQWLGSSEGVSAIKQPPALNHMPYTTEIYRWYWAMGLTLIVFTIFILSRLEKSRVGRAWTAIREDEDAAELMGVPTFKFKLWAFAIGAAIGGLAGAWYAGQLTTIYPSSFDVSKSILFLAAVVMGGLGNKWGAVLGGFAVAYLPERFRFIDDRRFVVFGLVLIAMMIFRPQGLLPRRLGARKADASSGGGALKNLMETNFPEDLGKKLLEPIGETVGASGFPNVGGSPLRPGVIDKGAGA